MTVKVWVSGSVRASGEGKAEAELAAANVAACIDAMDTLFPGLKARLYKDECELQAHIDVYVNGESIRSLQGLATPLEEGDEVSILPAFAGA